MAGIRIAGSGEQNLSRQERDSMKVTIVGKKNENEMTIEDLAECDKHIGWNAMSKRNQLIRVNDVGQVILVSGKMRQKNQMDRLQLIREFEKKGTFHVFDTAKELYLWLAEGAE